MKVTLAILTITILAISGVYAESLTDVHLKMLKHERNTAKTTRIENARKAGHQYIVRMAVKEGNTILITNDNVAFKIKGAHFFATNSEVSVKKNKIIVNGKSYKLLTVVVLED